MVAGNATLSPKNNTAVIESTSEPKRKACWWESISVIAAIISVGATIWIGHSANSVAENGLKLAEKSVNVAELALQESKESNKIAVSAIQMSSESNVFAEKATDLSQKSNEISLRMAEIAKASNELSFAANNLVKKSNDISSNTNQISKDSLKTANVALAVSEEMKKIAEKSNEMTQFFNRIQYDMQRSNLLKEGTKIFSSEKALCALKIMQVFREYFYLMSDISPSKMNLLLRLRISHKIEDQFFSKNGYIKAEDFNEERVLKLFINGIHEECDPVKNGFSTTGEAINYYLFILYNYAGMVSLYRMNDEVDEFGFSNKISDKEYFITAHLDKNCMIMIYDNLTKNMKNVWDLSFRNLLHNKKECREELLKIRDQNRELIRNDIQFAERERGWFTKVAALDNWKALLEFSEKNDRRNTSKKN